jgi:hypothetical protein
MPLKANFSLSTFRGNLHCVAGRGFAQKTKCWNKSSQWKSFPLRPYALPAPLIQLFATGFDTLKNAVIFESYLEKSSSCDFVK